MRIIGPPSATYDTVRANLHRTTAHVRFLDEMLDPLWDTAVEHTIDPVGVVAQAYKETGGGHFGGRVNPQHYNTAGIKVRHPGYGGALTAGDEQLAHAAFASWDVGALAHVQHLCAYAGWPVEELVVDPRYWLVIGKHAVENFEELSGKWAPAASYGPTLVDLARRLSA